MGLADGKVFARLGLLYFWQAQDVALLRASKNEVTRLIAVDYCAQDEPRIGKSPFNPFYKKVGPSNRIEPTYLGKISSLLAQESCLLEYRCWGFKLDFNLSQSYLGNPIMTNIIINIMVSIQLSIIHDSKGPMGL